MEYPKLPEGYRWRVDFDLSGDLSVFVERAYYEAGEYAIMMPIASAVATPETIQRVMLGLAAKINAGISFIRIGDN